MGRELFRPGHFTRRERRKTDANRRLRGTIAPQQPGEENNAD
jgi:hypothetical protein